jgi:hypothetical protein
MSIKNTPKSKSKSKSKSRTQLPRPKKSVLEPFGYVNVKYLTNSKRRKILLKASKKLSYKSVIGRLTLISNLVRNRNPSAYAIFKSDQKWLSQIYKLKKLNDKCRLKNKNRGKSNSKAKLKNKK